MLGSAAIAVDNNLAFLNSLANWVKNWSLCPTFTLSKQTSHVLVTILRTTLRLITDHLQESRYEFVLANRFQSDLIEKHFTKYCGMSDARSNVFNVNESTEAIL